MADLQKTVEIVFGAKSAELEKALGTIESKLTSINYPQGRSEASVF